MEFEHISELLNLRGNAGFLVMKYWIRPKSTCDERVPVPCAVRHLVIIVQSFELLDRMQLCISSFQVIVHFHVLCGQQLFAYLLLDAYVVIALSDCWYAACALLLWEMAGAVGSSQQQHNNEQLQAELRKAMEDGRKMDHDVRASHLACRKSGRLRRKEKKSTCLVFAFGSLRSILANCMCWWFCWRSQKVSIWFLTCHPQQQFWNLVFTQTRHVICFFDVLCS